MWLVVGMQMRVSGGGTSGIEIYVLRPFTSEIAVVDELAVNAWLIGGAGLVLALGLGFLAARGVLRPVRELRLAAWRLGQGDLSARVPVRGRDELASVATTFNSTAASLEHHVGELRRMESDARRFVADVSHELRTPLAAMTAVTDVLDAETASLPGVAGQAARLVNRETQNLTRLVNDLIEVTRFDSGTAALALDDVDVADVVRATPADARLRRLRRPARRGAGAAGSAAAGRDRGEPGRQRPAARRAAGVGTAVGGGRVVGHRGRGLRARAGRGGAAARVFAVLQG